MNRLSWLLFVTVLFLGACLAHSTKVMEKTSQEMRWLIQNCNL